MKKIYLIIITIIALTLTACSQSATPEVIPTVSLDSSSSQPSSSSGGNASASGVVVPVKKVELAFPTLGAVKTVEVVAGDSVTANQPLVTLDASILESRIKEAEANVIIAQTNVMYLRRSGEVQERIDAAKADVERAQAAVDIAKAQLAQATLVAPFDGTIASVEISPAEIANPGQIIIVMGDLTHFQIETTDLSEKDAPSVQVGQTANVFIDALGQEFSGKVVDIARVSETVGGDVVYKVTIELDEQPEGLRWGMSTEVKIETK
ncbi:MAG: HlyD family efflux transporter periplasmic adaptor subunit [Anaerolineales bacterium]|nr:HlyD family efflux transporter periplasmic adaptor subunit [Anaerolineales bacterium]